MSLLRSYQAGRDVRYMQHIRGRLNTEKPDRKKLLSSLRCRWEDTIKTYLKQNRVQGGINSTGQDRVQ